MVTRRVSSMLSSEHLADDHGGLLGVNPLMVFITSWISFILTVTTP